MTQLLVSVRNADEAQTVAPYPIAILDVKEPDRGALGLPDPETLRQITKVVPEHQTMSFAAGELSQWRQPESERTGNGFHHQYGGLMQSFRYVKIGLAGMRYEVNWQWNWQVMIRDLPGTTSAVVVSYFDYETCCAPPPRELIEFAAAQPNCSTILFDTYNKSNDLFGYTSSAELAALVNESKSNGLQTVVAGSVNESSLVIVTGVNPDFVGVRGAVCRGQRGDKIDGRLVNELASTLQALTEN